jgi:hypothetical protein
VAIVIVGLLLALTAPAWGATPADATRAAAQSRWSPQDPSARPSSDVTTTTRSAGADALPFSGMDVAFAVLVAGGLFLLGAALRRLSTRAPQS